MAVARVNEWVWQGFTSGCDNGLMRGCGNGVMRGCSDG